MQVHSAGNRSALQVDPLLRFIGDRCHRATHFGEQHKRLRTAYLSWCKDYDLTPVSDLSFCEMLSSLGFEQHLGTMRRWTGLRLL